MRSFCRGSAEICSLLVCMSACVDSLTAGGQRSEDRQRHPAAGSPSDGRIRAETQRLVPHPGRAWLSACSAGCPGWYRSCGWPEVWQRAPWSNRTGRWSNVGWTAASDPERNSQTEANAGRNRVLTILTTCCFCAIKKAKYHILEPETRKNMKHEWFIFLVEIKPSVEKVLDVLEF